MPRSAQDGRLPQPDLFARARFDGFGPSRFHPPGETPGGHRAPGTSASKLKQAVRENATKRPGVYAMLDKLGRIVYVGKAKNLRCRLLSYFREDSRHPKAGRIIRHTRTLVWEFAETEFAALLRELELIQMYRPRFNVLGMPGRQRYCWVCVGRPPAAMCYVAQKPTKTDVGCYGPFFARWRVEQAVRRLNEVFHLRDCKANLPMAFADQTELFELPRAAQCLRYELGTCLGPCSGSCTRRQYTTAVRAATSFLEGKDRRILDAIRTEMTAAAVSQQYERASGLRDKLLELEWLDSRLSLLRRARDQATFVFPTTGHDGQAVWYVIHRGQVSAAVRPPVCAKSRRLVKELLESTNAGRPPVGPFACHPVDSVLLIAAWMRKYPTDRATLRPVADVIAEL